MKFNNQYRWFRQYELTEDYASRCIPYDVLKKPLAECRKRDPSIPPPDKFPCQSSHRPVRALCTACDDRFWPILGKSIDKVSKFFQERAAYLLSEHGLSPLYQAALEKNNKTCWFCPWRKLPPPHPKIETDAELKEEVRQLVDFAHVNAMAVKKLTKKYDKVHRTGAGKEFMQRILRKKGNSFLVDRALLHELEALYSSLKTETPRDAEIVKELKKHCRSIVRLGILSAGGEGDEEQLQGPYPLDLNCPLCLEVLFDPVALKCSHVFCRVCACQAAHVDPKDPKGLEAALKGRRCPMCRQAGVFNDATSLPEVGALVKQRFPEEWNDRENEFKGTA